MNLEDRSHREVSRSPLEEFAARMNAILMQEENRGKIRHGIEVIFSKDQARTRGFLMDSDQLKMKEFGSMLATEDVPIDACRAISLAVETLPDEVIHTIGLNYTAIDIPLEVTVGSLFLANGKRVPATVDINDDIPFRVLMSLENIRLSFGLSSTDSSLDVPICYAVAAHEIADFIQVKYNLHDAIFSLDEKEAERASKHSQSLAEDFSNKFAIAKTREVFGVGIQFSGRSDAIYTPEPKNS